VRADHVSAQDEGLRPELFQPGREEFGQVVGEFDENAAGRRIRGGSGVDPPGEGKAFFGTNRLSRPAHTAPKRA